MLDKQEVTVLGLGVEGLVLGVLNAERLVLIVGRLIGSWGFGGSRVCTDGGG